MNNVDRIKERYNQAVANPFCIMGFSLKGIPRTDKVLTWIRQQKDLRCDSKNCYFKR